MLKSILAKYDAILYVQIWGKRIKVTNITSKKIFDEKALIAVSIDEKGKKSIEAIGNNALLATNEKNELIKPFSHPRLILSSFTYAQCLLTPIFSQLLRNKLIKFKPRVVIHPMEKLEGGLGQIEVRALVDLGLGLGARDVVVYVGVELPTMDFCFDKVKRENDY